MKQKEHFNMTKKIKLNLTILIIIIAFYIYISSSFLPLRNINELQYFVNLFSRIILAVFLLLGYVYYLIAGIYKSKVKRNLTIDYFCRNENTSIYEFLKLAFVDSSKKYQAQIPGKNKNNASGIIFGIDENKQLITSSENEEEHVLCIGGTGSGKTSAILIPTLRVFSGNSFVIDISGDISENVNRPNTLVFDLAKENYHPYNIFHSIDIATERTEKIERLNQISFLIMPDQLNSGDDGRFFCDNGRKMLISCLIFYYDLNLDFSDICQKIVSTEVNDLLCEIWDSNNEDARIFISSFRGTNEKNTAGCKQAMDQSITLFASNKLVRNNLRRPKEKELSICPMMLENYNVFIRIDESKLNIYAPLISIIIAQMFEYFSQRSTSITTPILFCLDEFARLGQIDILDALRTLRKRRVRIILLTQSFADLDAIYGECNRKIIADNCSYKVILKATDPDTQEYLSRLIGEYDSIKITHSWSQNHNTISKSTQKARIIEPAELSYLGNYLILHGPKGYKKLRKNYYFENH